MKSFFLLCIFSAFLGLKAQTSTEPAVGTGTTENPYQIATLENLYWIYTNTARWSLHYIQTADIDAAGTSTWDGNAGWFAIGNSSTRFTGSYDGQGFKIDFLFINRNTNNNGLFGQLNGATIKNLGLTNVNITAPSQVGGLAGQAYGTTLITNCYVTGSVSGYTSDGYTSVGGMVGSLSNSTIRNCYASVTVNGRLYVGGLVGYLSNATLANSYSTGSVTGGAQSIGGLAGYIHLSGKIDSCYSGANIAGPTYVGGAVGAINGGSAEVYRSYATGNVSSSSSSAGGFFGYMWNSGDIISNCYSLGSVTRTSGSNDSYGGFGGYHQAGTISNCYSTGSVNFGTTKGFLGGSSVSTYSANFFDNQSSGQTSGTGATAKTTSEMKTNTTFLNAGWSSIIWFMDEDFNSGYPYLSWQNPSGTPLPVELISFTANVLNQKVLLNWTTATELNNYGFEIERSQKSEVSIKNKEFEKIGFVAGHGNSNSAKEYTFIDESVSSGIFSYRLKQIDTDGSFSFSDEVEIELFGKPENFVLYQNYPNPFNPKTVISFAISAESKVQLKVYDIIGNEIEILIDEIKEEGFYSVEFNANKLSSGVYFYKLQTDNVYTIRKMILLR